MTICWIPFPMVARFCWDGYTSFKKRSRWIFCVVCCTSWHHPTMIQLSIRFQFQRIYSKPATKATWHFAAFRSTKKNPPRMGSKPSFQCWVDIEGMISMMYQLVTSEWSEDGPSRLSVVFFFNSLREDDLDCELLGDSQAGWTFGVPRADFVQL